MPIRNRKLSRHALTILALTAGAPAADAASNLVPVPRPRPAVPAASAAPAPAMSFAPVGLPTNLIGSAQAAAPVQVTSAVPTVPLAMSNASGTPAGDIAIVKNAISLVKKNKIAEATQLEQSLSDPLARKVVEWVILRDDDNGAEYARYAAFISANPSWPSIDKFRRRAEHALWQERADPQTVRAFFNRGQPQTAKGRFVLARALMANGDRRGALPLVRESWRNDDFSAELESQVLDMFPDFITAADHKARMDRRLYAEDEDTALRAAQRLGATEMAIARARIAVMEKSANAKALLEAVPANARNDAGYIFNKAQWLRRQDKPAEAAQLMLSAPTDIAVIQDTDKWWEERRVLARKLLDEGDPRSAYRIARDAALPGKDNWRADQQFTAGWIALRFLNDPATGMHHFAQIANGSVNPHALSRAAYWMGRAAEAAGRPAEARRHYEKGAIHSVTYYGQLARAKIGLGELKIHGPYDPGPIARAGLSRLEIVRAVEILYAVDERDMVIPIVADLGERGTDMGMISAVAGLCAKHGDARALLIMGKGALGRGLPADAYAYPIEGLPRYASIGPAIEPPIAYSIARQESGFNPRVVSSAKAMGLMQVTPEAARYIAKRHNGTYDVKRLLSDQVYNMQMGAAELGGLIEDYRGSYIMTFAGYNAGRGRVRDWIARYGDPRDPKVDAVDWVERIPFAETRNYVQRIVENLQVYRVRFGGSSKLLIEADLQRGATAN